MIFGSLQLFVIMCLLFLQNLYVEYQFPVGCFSTFLSVKFLCTARTDCTVSGTVLYMHYLFDPYTHLYQSVWTTVIKCHKLDDLNSRNLLSHSFEASKTAASADLLSPEASLLGSQTATFFAVSWNGLFSIHMYLWCPLFWLGHCLIRLVTYPYKSIQP